MKRPGRSRSSLSAHRSTCPIACSLDLFGDRWTLLVIRDLFAGKSRYGEFLASGEGIPTNVLADRLKRLEGLGAIDSEPYQQNPPRFAYSLTQKGRALGPVIGSLALWGVHQLPKTRPNKELLAMLKP
jgi:DNA-binding HxlR family transcriptional regulator